MEINTPPNNAAGIIDWNLEVILASSESDHASTLKPRVTVCLENNRVLELTPTAFSELRYQVAEAVMIVKQCKEIPALKSLK